MEAQGHAEPTGRAKLTRGYALPARYVLHTVGPIVHGGVTRADREALAAEYAAEEGSPLKAAAGGYLTDVVAPEETKAKIAMLLEMLAGKRVSRLPKKHSNIQL